MTPRARYRRRDSNHESEESWKDERGCGSRSVGGQRIPSGIEQYTCGYTRAQQIYIDKERTGWMV
jgi:hypothetical protein